MKKKETKRNMAKIGYDEKEEGKYLDMKQKMKRKKIIDHEERRGKNAH